MMVALRSQFTRMVRAKAMVLVLEVSTAARCGLKINEKEL